MRQQYHHRKVENDIFIWDVNKLARLSADMVVSEVLISDIRELDEMFWYSEVDGNKPTCRSVADHAKLIEETDLKYPVLICSEGRMIDGMHRVCKAYTQGLKTVKAVKFNPMPEPDYKNINLNELPYED